MMPFHAEKVVAPCGPLPANPAVEILGDAEHPDFREVSRLLQEEGDVSERRSPELVVALQTRPGALLAGDIEAACRRAPLAGLVAVCGSWCEGEIRSGRPIPGAWRMYWYQFPAWWRRQLARRSRGLCPEWALPREVGLQTADCEREALAADGAQSHVVAIAAGSWDEYDALSGVFLAAKYATVWQQPHRKLPAIYGLAAGVWVGGQLDSAEAQTLQRFSQALGARHAPVVALLDFPRRDRVDQALAVGAAAVLGKPWGNADLLATMRLSIARAAESPIAALLRAA